MMLSQVSADPVSTNGRGRLSRTDKTTDAHLKRQIMGREVVVAVTNGRLDGFAKLAEIFGTGERIFPG